MKSLVVRCHAGLGNRIRALVSAQRAARILQRRLLVQWPIDGYHCACHFNALFDTPHTLIGDGFDQQSVDVFGIKKSSNFIKSNAQTLFVQEENFFWCESDHTAETFWGQLGPRQVRDEKLRREILSEFRHLKPSLGVDFLVRQFYHNYLHGRSMVAVHVRREDNDWSNRFCTDSSFLRPIQQFLHQNSNAGILLCTDGDKSREFFARRFGSLVTEYPIRSLDRGNDWRAVQDALVLMLLMSKCKLIVRSASSTFSQCASWFGGMEVNVIDAGRPQHFH